MPMIDKPVVGPHHVRMMVDYYVKRNAEVTDVVSCLPEKIHNDIHSCTGFDDDRSGHRSYAYSMSSGDYLLNHSMGG